MQDCSLDNTLPLAELEGLIRSQLREGGTVVLTARGSSMRPLFRDGQTVFRLKPVTAPLRKYDIPFYKRSNGQFILHRVIGKDDTGYICRGDHQVEKEHGVTDDMLIGVLCAYRTKKRWHDPSRFTQRLLAAGLSVSAYPRAYARAVGAKCKRLLHTKP